MSEEVEFVVAGRRIRLTRQDVIERLRGVSPGPIREHAVVVEGVFFPVKQALARAGNVDPLDFNTALARQVFLRLGFEVKRC